MSPTQRTSMVNGGDDLAVSVIPSMRKSCNLCFARKRKCDGDGFNRCSLCTSRGPTQPCVYGERRRRRTAYREEGGDTGSPGSGVAKTSPPSSGKFLVRGTGELMMNPTMKRCRMTASPATGLIGMQESQHLDDFVECLGILDLASERNIRRAMVKIMSSALDAQQQWGSEVDATPPELSTEPLMVMGRPANNSAIVSAGRAKESADAVTCMLWCAIALGGLIRGRPVEQVTGYVQLAREALGACFDDGTVETARAYLIIAMLHHFLGDEAKRESYVAFATSIIDSLVPSEVPPILRKLLHSEQYSLGNMPADDLPRGAEDQPKVRTFSRNNKDIGNFALWVDSRCGQAFFEDMRSQGAFSRNAHDQRVVSDMAIGDEDSAQFAVEASLGNSGRKRPPPDDPQATGGKASGPLSLPSMLQWKEPDPPTPSDASLKVAREIKPEMERIIRSGEENMSYLKVISGETMGSYKSLLRCVGILERYPGLYRYTCWTHFAHCLVAAFALRYKRYKFIQDEVESIEAELYYTKVREAYNSTRQDGYGAIPPLEEWAGVEHICEFIYCRSICASVSMILAKMDGYNIDEVDSEIASPQATFCDASPMPTPVPPTPPPSQLEASLPYGQCGVASGALADDSETSAEVGMPRSSLLARRNKSLRQGEDMGSSSVDESDSVLGGVTLMLQDLTGCTESSSPESSGDWSKLGAGVGDGEPALVTPGDSSDLINDLGLAGSNQGSTEANAEFGLTSADLLEAADALLEAFGDGDDILLGDWTEMADTGRP